MFKWEQFEDNEVVIRSRKSQKDIQNKGQTKNHKRTNNDPLNIIQKSNYRTTSIPLRGRGAPERISDPTPHEIALGTSIQQ